MGPSNNVGIFVYYEYIQDELGNMSGVILSALFT
jgi:hypothetical protein